MSELITAIGLVLVIEGLLYGGFPNAAKRLGLELQDIPEHSLRVVGVGAMAIGVIVVWLSHG